MTALIDRSVTAIVGTSEFAGLRMSFGVETSDKPEPNTMTLKIWNLSAASRGALGAKDLTISLDAGYVDNTEQIFLGDVELVSSQGEGQDRVTTIEAGDGSKGMGKARVNKSFAAGARVKDVMTHVAESMGVGIGDALSKIQSGDIKGGWSSFVSGTTVTGTAIDEMNRLTRSAGMEWFVKDNVLRVRNKGEPSPELAIVLTPTTGLIGSPEPGENGAIVAKGLIQPGYAPGRKIRIENASVDGDYLIRRVQYTGDTHGGEWYGDIEATPL